MQLPILTTDTLTIRPFVADDLPALLRINFQDEEPSAADRAATSAWVDWSSRNVVALERLHQPPYGDRAVVLRSTGEVVGACGFAPVMLPLEQMPYFAEQLRRQPVNPGLNTHEMGLYWAVDPAHQRHGIATEAAAALIDFAFTRLRLKRIVATTSYDNDASIGVMRRLGMRIERNPQPEPPWMQIVGVLENPAADRPETGTV